jgi:hypothetical protein
VDLGPLLNSHAFLRVERPPTLWHADVNEELIIRMLGEMIAAALVRGAQLGDVVLRINNVSVEDDGDGCEPIPGDYVSVTIIGMGEWRPETVWRQDASQDRTLLNSDLDAPARRAGARYGYVRQDGESGSVTVFVPRLRPTSYD